MSLFPESPRVPIDGDDPPAMQGWLAIQNGASDDAEWDRQWFVLRRCSLESCALPGELVPIHHAWRAIAFGAAAAAVMEGDRPDWSDVRAAALANNHPWGFTVDPGNGAARMNFDAGCERGLEAWLGSISRAVAKVSGLKAREQLQACKTAIDMRKKAEAFFRKTCSVSPSNQPSTPLSATMGSLASPASQPSTPLPASWAGVAPLTKQPLTPLSTSAFGVAPPAPHPSTSLSASWAGVASSTKQPLTPLSASLAGVSSPAPQPSTPRSASVASLTTPTRQPSTAFSPSAESPLPQPRSSLWHPGPAVRASSRSISPSSGTFGFHGAGRLPPAEAHMQQATPEVASLTAENDRLRAELEDLRIAGRASEAAHQQLMESTLAEMVAQSLQVGSAAFATRQLRLELGESEASHSKSQELQGNENPEFALKAMAEQESRLTAALEGEEAARKGAKQERQRADNEEQALIAERQASEHARKQHGELSAHISWVLEEYLQRDGDAPRRRALLEDLVAKDGTESALPRPVALLRQALKLETNGHGTNGKVAAVEPASELPCDQDDGLRAKVVAVNMEGGRASASSCPSIQEGAQHNRQQDMLRENVEHDASDSDDVLDDDEFERLSAPATKREAVAAEQWTAKAGWKPPVYAKSAEERAQIKAAVAQSFTFAALSGDSLEQVIDAFKGPETVDVGSEVIRQGDTVTSGQPALFVLQAGQLNVHKKRDGEPWPGPKVSRYETIGNTFGELALLYNCPRAATVVASSTSVIWSIDRDTFNHCVKGAAVKQREQHIAFLESVELLQSLTAHERSQIADVLRPRVYEKGDTIICKGEEGTEMFFVESGSAYAELGGRRVKEYHPSQYFGELALLRRQPRAVDVIAGSAPTRLLSLDGDSCTRLLGSLSVLMNERANAYGGRRSVN